MLFGTKILKTTAYAEHGPPSGEVAIPTNAKQSKDQALIVDTLAVVKLSNWLFSAQKRIRFNPKEKQLQIIKPTSTNVQKFLSLIA